MEKPTIFISYSHKDAEWLGLLVTHLNVLKHQGLLDYWTDVEIGIGDAWFQKIQDGMNAATVAIMLISAHFLTSTFIRQEEIERLLKRRDEEGLPIFPILVRPCAWDDVPWLAQMQIRPQGGKALASYNDPHGAQVDEHLTAIVKEIRTKLKEQAVFKGSSQPKPSEVEVTREKLTPVVEIKKPVQLDIRTFEEQPPRIEVVPPPVPRPIPSPIVSLKEITNSIGMKLILIPAGDFLMGSENGSDEEKPVRRVHISQPFYLGKYPVTQAQWRAVMGNNPSHFQQEEGWLFTV